MIDEGLFRRRNLPHIDVDGKPYFITGCLAGSIPASGMSRIRSYRQELEQRSIPNNMACQEWEEKKHKLVFRLVDSILDGEPAVKHLEDDRLADIVQNAFSHFAGERYQLFAYVVMPSHHHWVFLPDPDWSDAFLKQQLSKCRQQTPRESISHSIQSFTATRCNRILGRTGTFWQDETFDHFVRNETELLRIIHYIENNPVVARLCEKPEDYKHSSASIRKKRGIEAGQPISRGTGF
ncbi:hypothetical protein Q31b_52010 [Novipirellula aureliae]|uniref:Transposase IS200-like domain-containing protein n=1 Tax=Novipirellula aureliae TaxID=2527966 RepID=A0A5C6DLG3_9BACT|nr:transposase [Novipirellula aureliae]TWU35766.1 hypothetical protein Q31b_52010 [Novipirellula aureliae]